ncbi:hypothetical protein GTP91_01580 [Rugamonas sp. FT82W]|uniref:Uncharacterized protein n=2 Tax=Duganella vulcania TaxID=2692166 RepID=A0A845FUV7_9BURK|nr:hypothetical protein [Duganella vulcania]
MQYNNMSTIISVVQNISLIAAGELALASGAVCALAVLFKPLLRGLARAAVLVVKPKRSKEEQLQRRQMRDAMMLKRMLNAMEGDPSHAAELRAMASRA